MKNKEITVLDQEIHINKNDYFSLTDIAKYKNAEDPRFVIQNWMRRIDTIQYIWAYGNNSTIRILTVSNSIRLEAKPVIITLQ